MCPPKASVIIPTYNGAHKIKTLLGSLLNQVEKSFEIIIVIDGSTDNTLDIVNSYKERFTSLITLQQKNKGRAGARNRGASTAVAPVLIFYDDDMEPDPSSVSKHIVFHNAMVGILSGAMIEKAKDTNSSIQNYKAYLTRKWQLKFPDRIFRMDHSNLFFSTANCSISSEVFGLLGGFDERLSDAEDYDFAYRALSAQVAVYFDASNQAIHHDRITCFSYIMRLREYGKAHAALRDLYPKRYAHEIHRTTTFVKRIIYRFFSAHYWPAMIDKSPIFLLLPKYVRYKLYDLVIHALAVEFPEKPL